MNTILHAANLTDSQIEDEAYRLKLQAANLFPEEEFNMLIQGDLIMISNLDRFEKHEFIGYIEAKGKVKPVIKYSAKADFMNLR